MGEVLLQSLITGITIGSAYALVGLGFAIIFNASDVVNFAQGEFVMIGAMSAVALLASGFPFILAIIFSLLITVAIGMILEKFAIEPAKSATVVSTIIITIGASIFLRGAALLIWGKDFHTLPAFSGDLPIHIGSATITPQSLWVMAITAVLVFLVRLFFNKTVTGKAILACSANPTAAALIGIPVRRMMLFSYGLSALLGGSAGVLIAPVAFTSYDAGMMLGLKGFAAAILGGLGNPMGAVAGGVILGVLESLGAGLISSGYKDAIAFVLLLLVLFLKPHGLFGRSGGSRV
ncbi:MAG: branched-chain amino acid ABC transporter permease [Magnetococcales bacterium]|nr:branched-chain amino acid ABC transporter permease [Magnetococcales bacterium]